MRPYIVMVKRLVPHLAAIAGLSPAQDRGLEHIEVQRLQALVIVNQTYSKGPLKNPANDAVAMEATLKKLGFDVMANATAT